MQTKGSSESTACDGAAITYDAIGNPLSDGTWTYTWQHGRQLAGMYGEGIGGEDNEVTITYTYDANGMRVGKTATTKTYETCVLLSNERNQHYNVSIEVDVNEKYHQHKKVTYKDIQDYVKEKYDFFAHSTYISEVKRECGLDVHEPYNSVENPVREYHCTEERKEQIKEALRHFGMI